MSKIQNENIKRLMKLQFDRIDRKISAQWSRVHSDQWSRWQREEQEAARPLYPLKQKIYQFCYEYQQAQEEASQIQLAASTKDNLNDILEMISEDDYKEYIRTILQALRVPLNEDEHYYFRYYSYRFEQTDIQLRLFFWHTAWFVVVECPKISSVGENLIRCTSKVASMEFSTQLIEVEGYFKYLTLAGLLVLDDMDDFEDITWEIDLFLAHMNDVELSVLSHIIFQQIPQKLPYKPSFRKNHVE